MRPGDIPILPTPSVAAVGLVADEKDILTQCVPRARATSSCSSATSRRRGGGLGGSEYQSAKAGRLGGPPPRIDLDAEKKLQRLVLELARAHVLVERARRLRRRHRRGSRRVLHHRAGRLARRRRTSTLPGASGGSDGGSPVAATLFGEAPSRVLVSMPKERAEDVMKRARERRGARATARLHGRHRPECDPPHRDHRPGRASS